MSAKPVGNPAVDPLDLPLIRLESVDAKGKRSAGRWFAATDENQATLADCLMRVRGNSPGRHFACLDEEGTVFDLPAVIASEVRAEWRNRQGELVRSGQWQAATSSAINELERSAALQAKEDRGAGEIQELAGRVTLMLGDGAEQRSKQVHIRLG